MSLVELVSHGSVRNLKLNAPERLNALDRPMLDEMALAVAEVAADKKATALVVSGEGRAFCAGADVKHLFGDTTRAPGIIRDELKSVYASFLGIHALPIPTIAAVQGAAVGAGVNIALACDVVVAGPRAKFVVSFADIGLHPGGGCSWFLTRRIGADRALATILGAETIDAEKGYEIGLVTRLVDDPNAEALSLAAKYSDRDRAMVVDMKRAVQLATVGDLASVLEFESWAQASSVTKARFQEFLAEFGR